jgi:hypothetical protein
LTLLFLACAGLPGVVWAQDSTATDTIPPAPVQQIDSVLTPVGTVPDSGAPIIRYVEVDRSDVFDSSETKHWPARAVNSLHIVTSTGVVGRELLLGVGQPWDSAKAAETERNLRKLGVFRKVRVDSATTDSGLVMKVITKDGWSTQADLRFRSTGGQTDWQAALIERNLLGTATRFGVRYRHAPDRNLVNFQFVQPRLFAKQVSLGLRYETRTDGTRGFVGIDRPFFSLSDRWGLSSMFDIRDERVLRFFNGIETPGDSLRRRYVFGRVEVAKALDASPKGYFRVGLNGQLRRDDYSTWPSQPPQAVVTGAIGVFTEWRHANFAVVRGFQRFGQDEDLDLSNFVRLGLYAAPSAFGYGKSGVGPVLLARFGTQFPLGFAWLDARLNGVYTSAGLDSGSVYLGATSVLRPGPKQVFITHADVAWLKDPLPGTEFDLGFAVGPRAFPIHAFTGDREYFTTAEYRYTMTDDFLKLAAVGVAGFADYGGAWYAGSPTRTGTDVGLGLRLSPSRVADANPTRLDLAYRFENDQLKSGWVFIFASGLVFSTQPRQGN